MPGRDALKLSGLVPGGSAAGCTAVGTRVGEIHADEDFPSPGGPMCKRKKNTKKTQPHSCYETLDRFHPFDPDTRRP